MSPSVPDPSKSPAYSVSSSGIQRQDKVNGFGKTGICKNNRKRNIGKMEAFVSIGEFNLLKEACWKMSSKLLLVEGFITSHFGPKYLDYCKKELNKRDKSGSGSSEMHSGNEDGLDRLSPEIVPAMPQMTPINTTVLSHPMTISTTSSPANTVGGSVIVNKNNASLPRPPALQLMKTISSVNASMENSNSSSASSISRTRRFLPTSLAPKPKVNIPTAGYSSSGGGNGNNVGVKGSVKKEIKVEPSYGDDFGAANSSDSSVDSTRYGNAEPPIRRKSPAISLSKRIVNSNIGSQQILPKSSAAMHVNKTPFVLENHYRDVDFAQVESNSEEDQDDYVEEGYLEASEFVATTLSPPSDSNKRSRYSFPPPSSSSSLNGTTPRQMRPNPCHSRCQNRCHDIWTDGDRMGVFQTYWNIPTEEERRDWVAQRIERVDMATKRTEYSNFRTCTFKYYLPHPDNAWVQVCKNFFLATIDEKRSYIEKIAQSVKGETERLSTKDIPFKRRNQVQRYTTGVDGHIGWMTGVDRDPDEGMEMNEVQD